VRDSKNTEFVVWANAQEGNGPLFFAKEPASATTYPDILKLLLKWWSYISSHLPAG